MPVTALQYSNSITVTNNVSLGTLGASNTVTAVMKAVANLGIGAGAGKVNVAYASDRTVSNGTPDVLNLTSGLLEPDGVTPAAPFADIMLIAVVNNSTTTGQNIQVGGGTDAVSTINGATGVITILPGGFAIIGVGTLAAAGYGITTTTADRININVAAGSSVSYTIIIAGH